MDLPNIETRLPDVKIIECPRDAMQGITAFVPTSLKIEYINALLKVGFDTIDYGSFVSPKAIPQMKDTAELTQALNKEGSSSRLLAIVANIRGAEDACKHDIIDFLGFPFSISETFQRRNTNSSIEESLATVATILELCKESGKSLVVYLSMGFGNPYGDPWNVDICQQWVDTLASMGVRILALSDTIGVATSESISYLYSNLIPPYPDVEFGAHFHTQPHNWQEKIEAAYANGCFRFDSAMMGYGGCPMAKDDLTGNMPTENILNHFRELNIDAGIDYKELAKAQAIARKIFH